MVTVRVARSERKLYINGAFWMYTLENKKTLFPAGTYIVSLTPSARAESGKLWTPWPDHQLPLIDVPKREGIRIHAANWPNQIEGCIAVGLDIDGIGLDRSRDALTLLSQHLTFPLQLVVED